VINLLLLAFKKGGWALKQINSNPIFKILLITLGFSIVGFGINLTSSANDLLNSAISDIRIYINTGLGFLTVSLIIDDRSKLKKFFNAFVLILLTQAALTIIFSYFYSKSYLIYTFFSGSETYYNGIIVLYFISLLQAKKIRPTIRYNSLLVLMGVFVIILFLFVVPSRGRILALAVPLLLFLLYTKSWKLVVIIPILVAVALSIVDIINPNFYKYFLWKTSTFNPMAEGAESSRIRYIELVNILGELFSNPYHLIFGKGLGGYFETHFMTFSGIKLGDGSYPEKWIQEGKYYKPHGTYLYFLLK